MGFTDRPGFQSHFVTRAPRRCHGARIVKRHPVTTAAQTPLCGALRAQSLATSFVPLGAWDAAGSTRSTGSARARARTDDQALTSREACSPSLSGHHLRLHRARSRAWAPIDREPRAVRAGGGGKGVSAAVNHPSGGLKGCGAAPRGVMPAPRARPGPGESLRSLHYVMCARAA